MNPPILKDFILPERQKRDWEEGSSLTEGQAELSNLPAREEKLDNLVSFILDTGEVQTRGGGALWHMVVHQLSIRKLSTVSLFHIISPNKAWQVSEDVSG